MTTDTVPAPDDAVLWPLIQVLGDIARRVERDEQAATTTGRDDDDESQAA